MKHLVTLCLSCLFLAGCSSDIEDAKQLLTDSLVVEKDASFSSVKSYPGGVVCGAFSGYVSYSEPMRENAPFIVRGGELDREPPVMDWNIFCRENPSAALFKHTGIGPFTADNQALVAITRDMSALVTALEAYYKDNYYYPSGQQGLAALVEKPAASGRRPLDNYRRGGYLDALPKDPWGRDYLYSERQWGRTRGSYVVSTLGQSAGAGGEGAEADITSGELRYLQHMAKVLGLH